MFRTISTMFAAAVMAAAMSTAAVAQKYPHDTVTLITHSKAGGGTDVFLREMTKHLGPVMGVNFVVENVRGGSGAKAIAKLATSPADGSIFYGTTPTFINTSLLADLQYTYKDLEGVVNVFLDPQIVYVRADSPHKDLRALVDAALKDPKSVRFGVTTPGSLDRQVMEKTVSAGIGEIQELSAQLEAGEVRLIATYTKERLDTFPDVATAREQGIDLVINKFRGIAGPKGLPGDIKAAWLKGINDVLAVPEFKAWYTAQSLVPTVMPSDEYKKFLNDFAAEQKEFFVKYKITKD